MLLSLTKPHEMPWRSLAVCICLSWRLSREAAAAELVDGLAMIAWNIWPLPLLASSKPPILVVCSPFCVGLVCLAARGGEDGVGGLFLSGRIDRSCRLR